MKETYPVYLQDFHGKVQIKRISPEEHSVVYYFTSKKGNGHYERGMDAKLATSDFDAEKFSKLEKSNEQNFLALAKTYSEAMLQMACILLEEEKSKEQESKKPIEL